MSVHALFGVDERCGKWVAVVQFHNPCNGGPEHRGCTVTRLYESEAKDTSDEAVAACRSFAKRLESQGLGVITEVTS